MANKPLKQVNKVQGQNRSSFIKAEPKLTNHKSTHSAHRAIKPKQTKPQVSDLDTIIVAFNKPYDVLTQFTDETGRKTLKDFIPIGDIYPAGRLDRDSEGLLILTNNGKVQHYLAEPSQQKQKTYWVQVEGEPTKEQIKQLSQGVELKDGLTKPAKVKQIHEPDLWQRDPPIRKRLNIPTSWLEIGLTEGKNRQVRRMTAHVGLPTLRLVRRTVASFTLDALQPGEYKLLDRQLVEQLLTQIKK